MIERKGEIDAFCDAWADPTNRPELAAAVGDWLAVPDAGPRATSAAMKLVADRPDAAAWCPNVAQLFARIDPADPPPSRGVSALFLFRHGGDPQRVGAALPGAASHVVGGAALLALEHAPEYALGLLRRALRSAVPANRSTAAAALALIDAPWSRAELLAVLCESDEQGPTSEARVALSESADPECRRAVAHWETLNPHEPETRRFITTLESRLRYTESWVRFEVDRLRSQLQPLLAGLMSGPPCEDC